MAATSPIAVIHRAWIGERDSIIAPCSVSQASVLRPFSVTFSSRGRTALSVVVHPLAAIFKQTRSIDTVVPAFQHQRYFSGIECILLWASPQRTTETQVLSFSDQLLLHNR